MTATISSSTSDANQVVTVDELARWTGRTPRNIRQMVKDDRLPFPVLRLGGRILFPRVAVEAWLSGELTARDA